jgi:hypothetical protein
MACATDTDDPSAADAAGSAEAPTAGAGGALQGESRFAARQLDVVLAIGCGDGHNDDERAGGFVLGGPSAEQMRASLLDATARAAPGLRLVVPGDVGASFLVRKLRGEFDGVACADGCGARLPVGNYPIAEGDRLDLEDWITGGAD